MTSNVKATTWNRVSSDDTTKSGAEGREELLSNLKSQRHMNREHVAALGAELVAEIVCDTHGASGASLLPQHHEVLALADRGAFDLLVVRDPDRLSRDMAKRGWFLTELEQRGVQVEYVRVSYADSPYGRLHANIDGSMAQFELDNIRWRTMTKRREMAASGVILTHGLPPKYGFRKTPDRRLVFDDDEIAVVRKIFDWADPASQPRLGCHTIAKRLRGTPSWADKHTNFAPKKAGYGEWSMGMVHRILTDEIYVGTWYYGKVRSGEQMPRDEWIAVTLTDENGERLQAVSDGQWRRVQDALKQNRTDAKRNERYEYLMARRLRCGHCGSKLASRTTYRLVDGKRRYQRSYYLCMARVGRIRGVTCDAAYWRVDAIDAQIWPELRAMVAEPNLIIQRLKQVGSAEQEEDTEWLRRQVDSHSTAIKELEAKRERLLDAFLKDTFGEQMLLNKKRELDDRIRELEQARYTVRQKLEGKERNQRNRTDLATLAGALGEMLAEDDGFEIRREVVEAMGVWATLTWRGEEVAIALYFGDPLEG